MNPCNHSSSPRYLGLFFRVLFVLGLFLLAIHPVSAQGRKRIAVYAFDDTTAGTRNMNVGAKVADALISKLAETGTFDVVDREYLNKIIAEQNLKMDERFDPAGAAKLGKLANIDALVIGHVDAFNANVSVQNEQGFISNKQKSVGAIELKVTARLISVQTASIISAPTANAQQSQVLAEASTSNLVQGMSKKSAVDTNSGLMKLVDQGIDSVSKDLSTQIVAASARMTATVATGAVSAKVIGMQDGQVLINRGSSAGIKVGDKFSIFRSTDTGLTDPDTGKPVFRRKKVCDLLISDVDDSVSSGKCDGLTQAGDQVVAVTN